MLAVGIILALLLLILCIPVGVDLRYEGGLLVKGKIGPLRLTVYPGRARERKPGEKREKRKRTHEKKPREKLAPRDLFALARIGLDALGRLRRQLSVDLFLLHVRVAAEDPYDAVLRFGALNAALSSLAPAAHRALKIRREDIRTGVDIEGTRSEATLRCTLTVQVWELLWTALCAGWAFLVWSRRRKKAAAAAKGGDDAERDENTQEERAS